MIVLSVAVAAASALGFSARMAPTYEAKAKVFVGPRSVERDDAAGALQELTFSREFVASYAEILKSRPLAEKVVEKTNAPITGSELASRSKTRIIPETRLIELSVTDKSPSLAQLYANEMVKTFVEDPDGQFAGGSGRSASVFEPALLPTTPVSPKPIQNGLIAALLGGFLGIGLAFLLERLDTAVRGRHDVERAIAPMAVIAQIPLTEGRASGVFIHDDPDSPQAEAMRILRTNIQFVSVDKPVKTTLVTSPFAGEGKTTVSVNLAASIAAIGSTALLIETDLRKPVLHDVLGVDPQWGLSNVLAGQIDFDEAIQKTGIPNLFVLTAGSVPPNPSELLGSQRMAQVIREAEQKADSVILDTSPALPVTDAGVLAPQVDGVVLVVRSGRTPTQKVLEAIKNFERHDVRVLGVAINGYRGERGDSQYYGYQYYRQARKQNKKQWSPGEVERKEREFLLAPSGPAVRPKPEPSELSRTGTAPSEKGGGERSNPQAAPHNGEGGPQDAHSGSSGPDTEMWIDPSAITGEGPSSTGGVYSGDANGNRAGSPAAPAPASAPNPGEIYAAPEAAPPSWPSSYYNPSAADPALPGSIGPEPVVASPEEKASSQAAKLAAGDTDEGSDEQYWEKPHRKARATRKSTASPNRKKKP